MKTLSKLQILIASCIIAVGGTAFATTASFTPSNDAMIFGTSSDVDTGNASGMGPGMFAGADGSSNIKRSMVMFDLSSLTGNPTLLTVELDLVIGQIAGSGGGSGSGGGCGMGCTYPNRTMSVYVVSYAKPWAEGTTGSPTSMTMGGTGQGWSAATCNCDDVTWKYNDWNFSTWANQPNDQDYGSAVVAVTFTNFILGLTESFTGDSSTNPNFLAAVQNWVTNPSENNGFEIRSDLETSPTSFIGWWTKDGAAANSNSSLSPVLTVTY